MTSSDEGGGPDSFHPRCARAAPSRWICLIRLSKARTVDDDDCCSLSAMDEKGWDCTACIGSGAFGVGVLEVVQERGLRLGRREARDGSEAVEARAGLANMRWAIRREIIVRKHQRSGSEKYRYFEQLPELETYYFLVQSVQQVRLELHCNSWARLATAPPGLMSCVI